MPDDRPRVLQVVQPEDGGVAEHVLQLSTGLVRRGWAVEAAMPPTSSIREALRSAGVVVHDVPMTRAPGSHDLAAGRLIRSVDARGRYALVHAHSSKAGALARSFLPQARRIVYTPHCFAFATAFSRPRRLLYTAVEQALVPRTGAIIGVCEWERDQARRRLIGATGRMDVVLNGVDGCADRAADPALLEFKGDRPLVGMVSGLREPKDPLSLVRAVALLGDDSPQVAIVGNGPQADAVRDEIASLGVGDRIRHFPFTGAVEPYLRALDLFVLVSYWEALSLSVLEAMTCGVPVLATRVGGLPEAVEPGVTGDLIPPGDPEVLAEAIQRLAGDPDRLAAMGRRGAEVAAERFGVDGMVDGVAKVYERLLLR